jgi:phenylalanine-4-hydroxylase
MRKIKTKRTKAENIEIILSLLKDCSPDLEGLNAEAYLNSVEEVKESLESTNILIVPIKCNRMMRTNKRNPTFKKIKIEKASLKQLYSFAVRTSREIRSQQDAEITWQQAIMLDVAGK